MVHYEKSGFGGDAPVILVRTIGSSEEIESRGLQHTVESTVDTLRSVLGERSANIVAPESKRTMGTAAALASALNESRDDDRSVIRYELTEMMTRTRFEGHTDAIKIVLAEAAFREIWSPYGDTGLVVVTSEYPILATLNAQEEARGIPEYEQTYEIAPGQVVLFDTTL